jgi:hypothetical protein
MPPIEPAPDKVKPWTPIHLPAPSSRPDPALARFEQAQEEWRDSDPAYRHRNPRPETWIPHRILETDYRMPIAEEREEKNKEYLEIVEEIKDQIPEDYYWEAQEKYAKPVTPDRQGPDETGKVDGYHPTMFSDPRFLEKDHSKYHALPREKMLPDMEKLYKMQEVVQVKESLDVPEDDGVDYIERRVKAERHRREQELAEESRIREVVFKGTHWIDWETGAQGWISAPPSSDEVSLEDKQESTSPSPVTKPPNGGDVDMQGVQPSPIPLNGRLSQKHSDALIAFAVGGSVVTFAFGLWKLFTSIRKGQKDKVRRHDEEYSGEVEDDDDVELEENQVQEKQRGKRQLKERHWNKEIST